MEGCLQFLRRKGSILSRPDPQRCPWKTQRKGHRVSVGGPASQICICLCSWGVWDQQSDSGTEKEREREFGSELSESGEGMILLLGFSVLAHQRWQECGINSRRLAMWHMGALCTVFAANLELVSKKAYFKMMTLLPIPSTIYPSLAPTSGSR